MSADKYPCIFSRQMEAIVYIRAAITKNKTTGIYSEGFYHPGIDGLILRIL